MSVGDAGVPTEMEGSFCDGAALFDGHDASNNIMRRILQASGAEAIHLGHNRSVDEIVSAAIQEDVQAIAVSSYQGGHMEYLKYMYDLLQSKGASHIQVFAGGGGVILPSEIKELHRYGIAKVFAELMETVKTASLGQITSALFEVGGQYRRNM